MPVALSAIEELSHRASTLDWGDTEAAMTLYFQLKRLLKGEGAHPHARGILVTVCRIIGYRSEAIEQLEILDRSWIPDGSPLCLNTLGQLLQFGFTARGITRAQKLMEALPTLQPHQVECLTYAGLMVADLPMLERLAHLGSIKAAVYLKRISPLTVAPHLAALQEITLNKAAPYMVGAEFSVDDDPETGAPRFVMRLLIDGSLIHASDLFDRIHETQGAHATRFPGQGVDWWPHYFVDVKAAPRHASIPAKARAQKAA